MEKKTLTQTDFMKMLDAIYEKALEGIGEKFPSVDEMISDYIDKSDNVEEAAKKFINAQVAKCTTSGFLTGLGGLITLPVAIPANVGSVLYVQVRMIAGIAKMAGYDIDSDQVQTLVYACLAGVSIDKLLKTAGIQFGVKLTTAMVKKIPGKVLTKINQKVGFRFITKFGTKGIINIGKMVPVVGGIIGGGWDFAETKIIANRAYKMFIEGDMTVGEEVEGEEEFIDAEYTIIDEE